MRIIADFSAITISENVSKSDEHTVHIGYSNPGYSGRAKPRVLLWLSKGPGFLVVKLTKVPEPKVAKPSGHCTGVFKGKRKNIPLLKTVAPFHSSKSRFSTKWDATKPSFGCIIKAFM